MQNKKLSKKAIAKALEKDRKVHEGRAANNQEQDAAFERLTDTMSKPHNMAILKRLANR